MMRLLTAAFLSTVVGLGGTSIVLANAGHPDETKHGANVSRLLMPTMNSQHGMKLFVDKGCVACHMVNGVGGHDATSLDAHEMDELMNPFDLAAKMWAMAPYMIAAQQEALGEQILLSGEELADIIAFLHDDVQQHEFSAANRTDAAMAMMDHDHAKPSAMEELAEAHN